MNRIKETLLILLVSFCTIASAQHIKVGLQAGIGSYRMQGLKELNPVVLKSLPFDAKIVSDFPPYFYYKPALLISFNKLNIGFQASYYSTGSRISSKDYSGEYAFDNQVSCLAPGLYIDYYLFSLFKKYKVALFSEGGITYSKLGIKETIIVNEQEVTNSSFSFKSKNYYAEPGIKFGYNIYRFLSLELNTSYSFQIGQNPFEADNNALLKYGPDWNGIRIGISVLATTPFK